MKYWRAADPNKPPKLLGIHKALMASFCDSSGLLVAALQSPDQAGPFRVLLFLYLYASRADREMNCTFLLELAAEVN